MTNDATQVGLPLVFWQPIPSIHQTPLLEQLVKDWRGPIFLVVDRESPKDREHTSGWSIELPRGVTVTSLGSAVPVKAIHIVSGLFGTAQWRENRRRVLSDGDALIWVMAESVQTWDSSLKGGLRLLRHGVARALLGSRLSGFFAIGVEASQQAKLLGVPESKIFPFCYVTAPPVLMDSLDPEVKRGARVLYVGRIRKIKGVDILFDTADKLNLPLTVIGNHVERDIQIPSHVEYLGVVPNAHVYDHIRNAEVLVLPSRHDGWGAVINEALMVGTPVVCTSACGGSVLLSHEEPYRGEIVTALTVDNLAEGLQTALNRGAKRDEIIDWSLRSISPEAVSAYMIQALLGKRMAAPWEH